MASAHGNGRQSRRRPAAGDIESLYRALSAELSPTGWWPADTTFEIMVGAVLTPVSYTHLTLPTIYSV